MPLDGQEFLNPPTARVVLKRDKWALENKMAGVSMLLKARNLIAKGWCRYTAHYMTIFGNHRYCAIGAMREAHDSRGRDEAYRALEWAIGTSCIVEWNDELASGKAEILAGFDHAIKKLEDEIGAV